MTQFPQATTPNPMDWPRLRQHPVLETVVQQAQALGARIYLVGGAVRDVLRTGQLPKDWDFVVLDPPAERLAKTLADCLHGHYVLLDAEHGIHRVVLDSGAALGAEGLTLDISDALGGDLTLDLHRRDLTLNAMALDLPTGEIRDPLGGQLDLAQGCIRMVSQANLLADPLRLLRVFRFAAQLASHPAAAIQVEPQTLDVVQAHAPRLLQSAPERIHYEFFRLLSQPHCFESLRQMGNAGLLEAILPEMTPMREIPPNRYHHLWLWDHTLELVRQAEHLWPQVPQESQRCLQADFNPAINHLGLVKLAALLHDIGKPDTMNDQHPEPGKVTFYGHEARSAEMCKPIFKRLRVGNDLAQWVTHLVRWHLYPCQFGPDSSPRSLLRFFRRMGPHAVDVIFLAMADRMSAMGPALTQTDLDRSLANHHWLLKQAPGMEARLKQPRLINGNEVMALLNCGPGPHLRTILDAVEEARHLGELSTEAEAKAWITAHRNRWGVPLKNG
ncbi:MAG: HD domain-containing protein [Candidatus Melainabacteria bacterium]|nr:HD domain-containing protein [Candidatus Melainabacteria bacterium]